MLSTNIFFLEVSEYLSVYIFYKLQAHLCHVSLAKKPAVFAACQKQHQEQQQQGQSDNDDEVGHVVVTFSGRGSLKRLRQWLSALSGGHTMGQFITRLCCSRH